MNSGLRPIYLAHNYEAREDETFIELCDAIRAQGWLLPLWVVNEIPDPHRPAINVQCQDEDLRNVRECEVFCYFTSCLANRSGLGKHIELGYALALRKPIIMVGERDPNKVFYWNPELRWVEDYDHLLAVLRWWPSRHL